MVLRVDERTVVPSTSRVQKFGASDIVADIRDRCTHSRMSSIDTKLLRDHQVEVEGSEEVKG